MTREQRDAMQAILEVAEHVARSPFRMEDGTLAVKQGPLTQTIMARIYTARDVLKASPPAPAEGEREVGGLTREGCDERGAIINALAYVLRTTYEIEEMSDDQRDIWRTLVGRARREYDRLLALAAPRPPSSPPDCPEGCGHSTLAHAPGWAHRSGLPGCSHLGCGCRWCPPSSPPTNRVTGETLPEWRERMHPRPFDGDAAIPSPDPGERTDVAWATQQRVHDLVYALDCIALHAAGEPTDPAEACRLIWKVADAARQPPAPSPAAAPPLGDWEAHDERWGLLAAEPKRPCTGCGVPLSNNTVLTGRPCAMCGHPQPEKKEGTT